MSAEDRKGEILETVDQAIEEGTFNLEAVQRVQEMREEWEHLKETVDKLEQNLEAVTEERDRLRAENKDLKEINEQLRSEATEVDKRAHELDVEEAKVQARERAAKTMQEFVKEVVRAPVVRTRVDRPVVLPPPEENDYGGTQYPSVETHTETREETQE